MWPHSPNPTPWASLPPAAVQTEVPKTKITSFDPPRSRDSKGAGRQGVTASTCQLKHAYHGTSASRASPLYSRLCKQTFVRTHNPYLPGRGTLERKTTDTFHGSTTRLAGTVQAAGAADGATSGVRRGRVDPRGHAQQGVGMRAAARDMGL